MTQPHPSQRENRSTEETIIDNLIFRAAVSMARYNELEKAYNELLEKHRATQKLLDEFLAEQHAQKTASVGPARAQQIGAVTPGPPTSPAGSSRPPAPSTPQPSGHPGPASPAGPGSPAGPWVPASLQLNSM